MNAPRHAVRAGMRRGWTEFVLSVRSPQDQGFYLFMALGVLAYLYVNRDETIEGTTLSFPTVFMPSILAGIVAFGTILGPAYALAMEREDGTLLRAKAVPHGIRGYVTGQVMLQSLSLLPSLAVIVIPASILFDDLMHNGLTGWVTMMWVLVLGLAATLPLGIIIGSLVPGVQKVTTWGMLPFGALVAISGIFVPIQVLWGWVQVIAQAFPLYWLGLGMRSAFLPPEAAALEVGGSWRPVATALVLAGWAVLGVLLTPPVLRRMARRQSGSAVEAARQAALQWVR